MPYHKGKHKHSTHCRANIQCCCKYVVWHYESLKFKKKEKRKTELQAYCPQMFLILYFNWYISDTQTFLILHFNWCISDAK